MKELSIEEKAKRYDEAMEKAKNTIEVNQAIPDIVECVESLFPELTESGEEEIRKEITEFFKNYNEKGTWKAIPDVKKWIDWLEKHAEQKLAKQPHSYELEEEIEEWLGCEAFPEGTNITPLPKAMEIVRETANHFYDFGRKQQAIRNIQCTNSQVITPESYINEGQKKGIQMVLNNPKEYGLQKPADKVEPKFHEGDWVVSPNGVYWHIDSFDSKNYQVSNGDKYCYFPIEKQNEMHLWTIQDAKDGDVLVDEGSNIGIYKEIEGLCWHSYIYLGNNNRLYGFSIGGSHMQNNTKPATKEQCDLLSQKMKESGYEWNVEKKELKKIEQKQERVDEDKKNYQMIQKIICDSDITAKMANKLSDWLKDLKEKMQPQSKEEWSVDDEDMHYKAIAVINRLCAEGKDYVWSIKTLKKLFYWLKSLKVRVQPQPKEEWGEDDEYYYGII